MRATLEPVAYVLRLHPDADAAYVGAATVTVDDAGVATVRGFVSASFDQAARDAIETALIEAGFTAVAGLRRRGKTRLVVKRLPGVTS